MTALLQGISIGSIEYQPNAPATGYVAFLALVLYIGRTDPAARPRRRFGSRAPASTVSFRIPA